MTDHPEPFLISELKLKYLFGPKSPFRIYQDRFIEMYAPDFSGEVVEIGGELHYNYREAFTNATNYLCTNIDRDYDRYLDITNNDLADNSVENILCSSVLEHIPDMHRALNEIRRVLKPGGRLLITVPFAYPHHDERDFWRIARDGYLHEFQGWDIRAVAHLGGMVSTLAEVLMRPRGKWTLRYTIYKSLALLVAGVLRPLERKDSFPLGYGLYAIKPPEAEVAATEEAPEESCSSAPEQREASD